MLTTRLLPAHARVSSEIKGSGLGPSSRRTEEGGRSSRLGGALQTPAAVRRDLGGGLTPDLEAQVLASAVGLLLSVGPALKAGEGALGHF